MDRQSELVALRRTENFLLVVDLLPQRLRSLAITELPTSAAAIADLAAVMGQRTAIIGRLAYVLGEHDWDLAVVGGFLLEARRHCRRVEVERMLAAHTDLALLATVYLEAAGDAIDLGQPQELFWAEEECRLVAA
jgi:hypothetical protein